MREHPAAREGPAGIGRPENEEANSAAAIEQRRSGMLAWMKWSCHSDFNAFEVGSIRILDIMNIWPCTL